VRSVRTNWRLLYLSTPRDDTLSKVTVYAPLSYLLNFFLHNSTLLYAFYATLGYHTFLSTLLCAFSHYPWLPYAYFYATERIFTLLHTFFTIYLATIRFFLLYAFLRYTWLAYVSFFTLFLANLRFLLRYSTPFYATPDNPTLISTLSYALCLILDTTLRVFCYDTFYAMLRCPLRFYLRTFYHSLYVTLNVILYASFYANMRCFQCFILRHSRCHSTVFSTQLSKLICYSLRFFLRDFLR